MRTCPSPTPLGGGWGCQLPVCLMSLAESQCNERPLEAFWEMANLGSPETTLRPAGETSSPLGCAHQGQLMTAPQFWSTITSVSKRSSVTSSELEAIWAKRTLRDHLIQLPHFVFLFIVSCITYTELHKRCVNSLQNHKREQHVHIIHIKK